MDLHEFDQTRRVSDLNDFRASTEKLDRVAERLAVFSKIGKTLISSFLDLQTAFKGLLPLVVPRLAEWCMIIVRCNDQYSCIAARHIDPEKNQVMQRCLSLGPKTVDERSGPGFATKHRKIELLSKMDPLQAESFFQTIATPEVANILRIVGVRSHLTVPLISGAEIIGVATFGMSSADRVFEDDDIELAAQIGSLLADLIKSSETYERAKTAEEKFHVQKELHLKYMRRQIHDIKTPLSAALLLLELVKKTRGNPDKEAVLIERATQNVMRAVDMLTTLISEEEKLMSTREPPSIKTSRAS